MHNRIPQSFKTSTLAVAVLALSGCASSTLPNGADLVGETLLGAGRVTANASVRALEGTSKIVGLDRLRRNPSQPPDEVDLALRDTARSWPEQQNAATSGVGINALRTQSAQSIQAVPSDMPAIASIPAIDPNAIPVATVDYTHVVGEQETMWTIAKSTTGNANNWRILAEINQLDLNTPMRIGQEILVPADLVLPEIVANLSPSPLLSNAAASNAGALNAQGQTGLNETAMNLPPLDLYDASSDALDRTMTPLTRATLESDPLDPANRFTDDAGEPMIVFEASASAAEASDSEPAIDPSINAIALKADAGETLWDLAKRTTGDATNWTAIADHNGFTETDIGRIRYGQSIYVPAELVKAELGGDKIEDEAVAAAAAVSAKPDIEADSAATNELVAASTNTAPQGTREDSVEASSELLASASNLMDETQDIKIVEAAYQPTNAVDPTAAGADTGSQIIMVSGTYYPKAVYNEADFSSSLLMRVSPGTEMKVSKAMGPWYEVNTENGIGYMHSRDIK